MTDDGEQGWTLDELIAIYNRAPKFFRALDLEDVNEIYRDDKESSDVS